MVFTGLLAPEGTAVELGGTGALASFAAAALVLALFMALSVTVTPSVMTPSANAAQSRPEKFMVPPPTEAVCAAGVTLPTPLSVTVSATDSVPA